MCRKVPGPEGPAVAAATTTRRSVRIEVDATPPYGPSLMITDPPAELLDALHGIRHRAEVRAGRPIRVRRTAVPLYQASTRAPATIRVPAGLAPVVRRVLRKLGLAVDGLSGGPHAVLPRLLPRPLPDPVLPARVSHPPADLDYLAAVWSLDRALVHHNPGRVDLAWLIAQPALAWPELRVVVLVSRVDDVWDLVGRLRTHLPDVTGLTSRNRPTVAGRVVVAPYAQVTQVAIDQYGTDLVIAANAAEAVSEAGRLALGYCSRARLVGLLPDHMHPAPHLEDRLRCCFGFEDVHIPAHGHTHRDVRVVAATAPAGRMIGFDRDLSLADKRGLWADDRRNDWLSRLAVRARTGQRKLRADFPVVADAVDCLTLSCPRNVVLLVDGVEHALAVGRRLPGWPVVAGPNVYTDGLPDEAVARLALGRSAIKEGATSVICTATGLKEVGLARADVVIRADAGRGGLPAGTDGVIFKYGSCRPLLMIDVRDGHHPRLRKDTVSRRQEYRHAGWLEVGEDVVDVRVEEFLGERTAKEGRS